MSLLERFHCTSMDYALSVHVLYKGCEYVHTVSYVQYILCALNLYGLHTFCSYTYVQYLLLLAAFFFWSLRTDDELRAFLSMYRGKNFVKTHRRDNKRFGLDCSIHTLLSETMHTFESFVCCASHQSFCPCFNQFVLFFKADSTL